MKPLTIDELKSLKAGDWAWISRLNNKQTSGYVTDINFTAKTFTCKSVNRVATTARIADYGKTWLAFKNKEQAEAKGEIVELPCNVGDTVYWVSCFGQLKVKEFTIVSIDAKTIDGELCWYAWGKNGQGGRCVDNGNSGWYLRMNKARAEEVLRFVKGDDNKWTIK